MNELSEITLIGPSDKLNDLKRLALLLEYEDANETTSADDLTAGMTPGNYLQAYRERDELYQAELAEKVGATPEDISFMESGKKEITHIMAEKLATALNCTHKRFL